MTSVLTTDGIAHLLELNSGATLTNAFDALVLDQSNATPAVGDDLSVLTERLSYLVRVVDGYPKQGDTDGRNGGSGASVWTWRFEIEEGAPFVASNFAVTNYNGGALLATEPLAVHGKETLAQKFDERMIVWVNADGVAAPTVFSAREASLSSRVQRVDGFVASARALSSFPNGVVVNENEIRTRPQRGQKVWTAANIPGINGAALKPSDVDYFTLTVERFKAADGAWEAFDQEEIPCPSRVFGAEERGDSRWRAAGGYNVAHYWEQPAGGGEVTYRLTYEMGLCDADLRRWVNTVEVRS